MLITKTYIMENKVIFIPEDELIKEDFLTSKNITSEKEKQEEEPNEIYLP